jgi:hypothetical protein
MNQYVSKVKMHVQENQDLYIGAGVGIVVTTVVVLVLKQNSGSSITQGLAINVRSPLTANTINVTIPKAGNSGNIIQCEQTGTVYASQNAAAKALDIPAPSISKHLGGLTPHVRGLTFTKLLDGGE